jgi:hypothetical protein
VSEGGCRTLQIGAPMSEGGCPTLQIGAPVSEGRD